MARTKQRGTCGLCLREDEELQRSHLLGRAVYSLNREGKDEPVIMTPEEHTPTQKQIWHHLLCWDCEQRFSKYGESPTMPLIQRKTDFALLNKLKVAVPFKEEPNLAAYSGTAIGIDTEPLAYFALSVVWRSSVRKWMTLGRQTTGISLGTFEEPIRKYLAGEGQFPTGVVVTVWVCTDLAARFSTFAPSTNVGAPSPTYSLLVRGLWFHIITGDSLPTDLVERCCCVQSARKVIFMKDCTREIVHAGNHIMPNATVSPKLLSGTPT
jgi:hypothetical protein